MITTRNQLDTLVQKDPNDPQVALLFQEVRERMVRAGGSAARTLAVILSERNSSAAKVGRARRPVGSFTGIKVMLGLVAVNAIMILLLRGGMDRQLTVAVFAMLNAGILFSPLAAAFFLHSSGGSLLSGGVTAVFKHVVGLLACTAVATTCSAAIALWSVAPYFSFIDMVRVLFRQ